MPRPSKFFPKHRRMSVRQYTEISTFYTFLSQWHHSFEISNGLLFRRAKWMWDRSIFSIIKPSFDIILFQDLWRFAQIWAQNCFCYCFWTDLRGVVRLKLFRNNKKKNNFALKSVQIFINRRTMPCQIMAQVSK